MVSIVNNVMINGSELPNFVNDALSLGPKHPPLVQNRPNGKFTILSERQNI